MKNFKVLNNPLINHKLAIIRNEKTGTKDFRQTVNEIASLMTYEISQSFELKKVEVKTPIGIAMCEQIAKEIVIIPILRAGIGMLDGIMSVIPNAKVGHIGVSRNEETLMPEEYYLKLPECLLRAEVILVDPMLATGGSASHSIKLLKDRGVKNIKYVGIVGAPEGVAKIQKDHPDVEIFLAALDEKLNEFGYIVPGLGDCGDRLFGTK